MRSLASGLFALLHGFTLVASAQEAQSWQQLFEEGAALEDVPNYSGATQRFHENCSAARHLLPIRLTCERLPHVQMLAGNPAQADGTVAQVVAKLRDGGSPGDLVRTLILWADVSSAMSDIAGSDRLLTEALELSERAGVFDQVWLLTRIGEYHYAVKPARQGARLLDRSEALLLSNTSFKEAHGVQLAVYLALARSTREQKHVRALLELAGRAASAAPLIRSCRPV